MPLLKLRSQRRPLVGALVGVTGVILVIAAFDVVDPNVTRAVPLLLLLLPVLAASFIGGWKIAVPLSIAVGAAYALAFVPPIGTIRIGLTEDTLTILSFVLVAVTVSLLADVGRFGEHDDPDRAVLLRTVSHDLRNPLGTIRAASTELRDDTSLDAAARTELLDLMVDETERLDRIVGNLLSMSRIEAGALKPDLTDERIEDIIAASVRRLERVSGDRITVHTEDGLPEVIADRTQIDQVITNLVENSIRHTDRTSAICISTRQVGEMVEVAVSDDGPGFSQDRREHPFELFRPSGSTGVTGVGLAVCKSILDAHGGSIRLGEQPGGGARVTFRIPTSR